MPRVHSIRELLGILAKKLEDLSFKEDALKIMNFVRRQREALIDIESAYTESRYSMEVIARSMVEEMLKTVGCSSMGELWEKAGITQPFPELPNFPTGKSELEVTSHIRSLASANATYLINFLGCGYYDHLYQN